MYDENTYQINTVYAFIYTYVKEKNRMEGESEDKESRGDIGEYAKRPWW